jgi:hypothetical protein
MTEVIHKVNRKYGFKKDPNYDSISRKIPMMLKAPLLPAVTQDLSSVFGINAYDQGQLGSCVFNAWAFCVEYAEFKQNAPSPMTPSRLGMYYDGRTIDGTPTNEDAGSTLTTGHLVLAQKGAGSEKYWPYDITKFDQKPPPAYYIAAAQQKGLQFWAVPHTLNDLKTALCMQYPVACGFNVHASFETVTVEETGVLPDPTASDPIIGGHAVVLVKLDDTKQEALFRNSYGDSWGCANDCGKRGYFKVSYKYLLSSDWSDFWIVQKLSEPSPAPVPVPAPPPTPSPHAPYNIAFTPITETTGTYTIKK